MNHESVEAIEQKIDRLIGLCARLQKENLALRERESSLLRERSQLLEKNELARNRVEGMITRLRGLSNEGQP